MNTNRERNLMQAAIVAAIGGACLLCFGALLPGVKGGVIAGTGAGLIFVAVHFVKEATR